MKPLKKIHLISLGLLLVPFTWINAQDTNTQPVLDDDRYQLPQYKIEEITLPIPIKTVAPIVGKRQIGQEVRMIFKVHTNGRPYAIRSSEAFPAAPDLASSMKEALPHWRFEPALNPDGTPVIVRVALPVMVVRKLDDKNAYTSIDWNKLELLAVNR